MKSFGDTGLNIRIYKSLKWDRGTRPGSRVVSVLCCHAAPIAIVLLEFGKKNKANHLMSSNSHPTATASVQRGGGGRGYKTKKVVIEFRQICIAVHPTAISENYTSSAMLIILIKAQTFCILKTILRSTSVIP